MKKRILSTLLAISMAFVGIVASPSAVNEVHAEDLSSGLTILKEYAVPSSTGKMDYFAIVRNDTGKALYVTANPTAYGADGLPVATDTDINAAMNPGDVSIFKGYMDTNLPIASYQCMFSAQNALYKPMSQYVTISNVLTDNGTICMFTNNADEQIRTIQAYAIFFKNGIPVSCGWTSLADLEPHQTINRQINTFESFDSVETYLSFAHSFEFAR